MSTTNAEFTQFAHRPRFSYSYLRRTFRLGFRSLWMHRLRSLLTVLGIVFGVASVIAMLAVGEGASHEAQEQIRRLGSNNIILRSLKPPEEDKPSANRSYVVEYGLKYSDIERIRATIPGVSVVVPARVMRNYIWRISHRVDCDIMGTVPWYPEMQGLVIREGRYFTEEEMEANKNVCVIDIGTAEQLFPIDAPIGKTVRIGSTYYTVVGVMERATPTQTGESGAAASSGSKPAAYRIYIPLSTAKNRFGETLMKRRSGSFEAERVELHEATVKVRNQDDVVETAAIIEGLLARDRKKKDYEMVVPLELLRQAERTKQIFNIVLGSIAAISLLVGGIGIMNIMLATVTERTREIGIRRALGAKRRDIVIQFLIETVILSSSGGIVGVALGISVPFIIAQFAGMTTIITFWSPAIAFSISAFVGIVFGIYPALRAAQMDPVEALRHE